MTASTLSERAMWACGAPAKTVQGLGLLGFGLREPGAGGFL